MTSGATTQEIANPLKQLPSGTRETVRVDSRSLPSDDRLASLRDTLIDLQTATKNVNQFFINQRGDAALGKGEKYRPCEREAQAVPVSVEVPGFIHDNQLLVTNTLRGLYPSDCSENPDDCPRIERGKIAEKLYEMAANVPHFRGQNAHRYISCLELADMFDEGIKYRLGKQLVSPALGPEEKEAEIRKTAAVISGVMEGTISVHPRKNHDESIADSSPAAGVTPGHVSRLVGQNTSSSMAL